MNYQGSCHCGNIAFEVEGSLDGVMSCNCSICQRKGALMWFVPRDALHLRSSESGVSTYLFNRHAIRHHFCATCGIHPYGEATAPDGEEMAAVNVRCLEGVDLQSLPVTYYDGRSR